MAGAGSGNGWKINTGDMIAAADQCFKAAAELDEAAEAFRHAVIPGSAPVIERSNRRARRLARDLHAAAAALRAQASSHREAAIEVARERGERWA